ncbi:NAD(P)-binding protein [Caulobacter sp. DWR1-3-2b1]|uniref:NAD(P)-binding protein n=1 Tax=Caulobacter sp. DWR1-3-2b1 TaxID=2804670 RepID=UPI003CF49394
MSDSVRIVGGGLTGILAAFEAHRLGWRDITIQERFDSLGGVARPKVVHGQEMRDGCVYFGGPGDPIVETLSAHGARFETFNNRFGSVSLEAHGRPVFTRDFGGPAVDCAADRIGKPASESLASRIAAYPEPIAARLEAYCRWHLEADLDTVHGEAAIPLAINRVFPAAADLTELARLKATNPWADELYAIPRGLSGRTANLTATLPFGGFATLFDTCHQALQKLGVKVELNALVSPRALMAAPEANETVVWAANPTPLFKPLGLATPKLVKKSFATYVFEVEFDGPCPVYVQNFTAQGAAFRVYLYESGGKTLAVAECVREADLAKLPTEMRVLMSGFGSLKVRSLLHSDIQPRWIYHSIAAIEGLKALRGELAVRFGGGFIPGAWEPYAKSTKLAEVNAALALAREAAPALAKAG